MINETNYLQQMLVHIISEVLDQWHLLLQLTWIIINGEELLVVVLVNVLTLNGVLVEYDTRIVIEQNADWVVAQLIA